MIFFLIHQSRGGKRADIETDIKIETKQEIETPIKQEKMNTRKARQKQGGRDTEIQVGSEKA